MSDEFIHGAIVASRAWLALGLITTIIVYLALKRLDARWAMHVADALIAELDKKPEASHE